MKNKFVLSILLLFLSAGIYAQTVVISAVGDLMFNNLTAKSNSLYPFESAGAILQKADIAVANLEVPLTTRGTQTPYKSSADIAARKQYVLRGNPQFAKSIKSAGIDIVSFSTNHAMDWGKRGVMDTLSALQQNNILHTGVGDAQSAYQVKVITVNGIRVAFISYLAFMGSGALKACTPVGENGFGVAIIPCGSSTLTKAGEERLRKDIDSSKALADIVVVSFHWGLERQTLPTAYQKTLARKAVDYGANLVLGHHPHVLQPYEKYKNGVIIYSLGNFVASNSRGALGDTMIFTTKWSKDRLISIDCTMMRIVNGSPSILNSAKNRETLNKYLQLCGRFCR